MFSMDQAEQSALFEEKVNETVIFSDIMSATTKLMELRVLHRLIYFFFLVE